MAFSESFELGDSTFLRLQSQAKNGVNITPLPLAAPSETNNGLEVIQESPKAAADQRNFTSHSRLHSGRDRNRFRRSKSDSTIGRQNIASESINKVDTAFFRSNITFSIRKDSDSIKEDSVVRVSQLKAGLFEYDNDEVVEEISKFEAPIFSEDVAQLLESEDIAEEVKKNETKIPTDHQGNDVEEIHWTDETSFITVGYESESPAAFLSTQLQKSHAEINAPDRDDSMDLTEVNMHNSNAFKLHKETVETNRKCIAVATEKNMSQSSVQIAHVAITDLSSLKSISAWNLPHSVLHAYEKKGVQQMFDWQVQCLSNPKVLFEHSNLVYSAPTSAGKTLVSEILLLKTVLERSKKVLLILPFISVVREKMFYLQDLLTPAGYRVEGFFGGYMPAGGFESINVAICTIEKANSIVNRLLEQGKLDDLGTVVVDEVHLISDPGRGYILELLLAKILYMSRKYGFQIQIITMSATLANVDLLKRWLDAELFTTDFRPVALQEMIKVDTKIYDSHMNFLRDIKFICSDEKEPFPNLPNDSDNVAQLCIETLLDGCSVVVFCPSKDWCENLAMQLAGAIHSLVKAGSNWGVRLRATLQRDQISQIKQQLRDIPTGLDTVLEKTITYACAFHHAGLTTEERDIVETSFKSGVLKIIVATSTLSSGVNLPARRVIIRTPLFGGKQMNSLTYRQMIGRAGRMGKDTMGESILICTESNARIGRELIRADLKPISSCLEMDSSTHLKRALLEVISSGVAASKDDINSFANCTLLSVQKKLKDETDVQIVDDSLSFLMEYEFVRLQKDEETNKENYIATRLGMACLASSMPPTDGLILFAELQKSRRCFVLESDLHAVYLVTPYSVCYQLQNLDWLLFLDLWERLSPAMKKVGELVGVKESFLVRAMRGQANLDYKLLQIHKRFYTALALQELVEETPISKVAVKYKCTRGLLQSLQQIAATFAGIVTAFCNSLQWSTLSLVVAQFRERLFFGVQRDLIDLLRLPDLNHKRARAFYNSGITTLIELANADVFAVEKILYDLVSFDSDKQRDHENVLEAQQRKEERNFFITGRAGLTVPEAAKMLVQEARTYVQLELGVDKINWTQPRDVSVEKPVSCISYEEQQVVDSKSNKRKSTEKEALANITPIKLCKKDVETEVQKIKKERTEKKCNSSIKQCIVEKPKGDQFKKQDEEKVDEELPKIVEPKIVEKKRNSSEQNAVKQCIVKKPKENQFKINDKQKESREVKKITKSTGPLFATPRRSPRNLTAKADSKMHLNKSCDMEALFCDSSFELHSSLEKVLTVGTSDVTSTEIFKKPTDALNRSNDEIPSSQHFEQVSISSSALKQSRLMRSLRTQSNSSPKPKTTPKTVKAIVKMEIRNSPPEKLNAINSTIELSDLSMENSLMQQPMLLNASHILSCSKTESDAATFQSVDIVDICGDERLFEAAFEELLAAKRCSVCLALQQQMHKHKPLIGANLLLNQMAESERQAANGASEPLSFTIDDSSHLAGVAFCMGENAVYYMNMQCEGTFETLNADRKCRQLCSLFGNTESTLLMFDAKEQLKSLRKAVPQLGEVRASLEDPKIASWLLQPDNHFTLQQLTQQYAPECGALVKLCGSGRGYNSFGLDIHNAILPKIRSSIEACVTLHILRGQVENLERIGTGQLLKFFKELEMPLQLTLANMEHTGFPASESAMRKLFERMVDAMKQLEKRIYELHGSRFNLASSQAVARVLGLHRKPNGRVNTSRQILEKMETPISQLILTYRKLSTTLAKNIQPLLKCIRNDRIHGQSITHTATGRISMVEPNLQNVAKNFDVELGTEKLIISCRSAFIPDVGAKYCLLASDFCQLEMRILAHLSQDAALMQAMRSRKDVFTVIAARWNKVPEDGISEHLRNGTKQICYAIIYGMGMRTLAEALKCTEQEARLVSEQFHAAYPGIRIYTERVLKHARQNGYVETITGRRRYLEHINSGEPLVKSQAERQAMNTTVQGSAADIAKSAMLRMERNIMKYRDKLGITDNAVRLILHLHDELIFEVPTEKARKIAKLLSVTMENCVKLSVPLKVKLKIGPSWGELDEIKL